MRQDSSGRSERFIRPIVRAALAGGTAALLIPLAAEAQRRGAPPQEFTQQILLVPNFQSPPDPRTGLHTGDAIRSRIGRGIDRRILEIVHDSVTRERMARAGFHPDSSVTGAVLHALARDVRADEYVMGTVTREGRTHTITGRYTLYRDVHFSVPVGPFTASSQNAAADLFVAAVRREREQLTRLRRCENAARMQQYDDALRHANEAIEGLQESTLARMCRMRVLLEINADGGRVLSDARLILARDSSSAYGIEGAARGYERLGRRPEAQHMWLRLARLAPDSLPLAEFVLDHLVKEGYMTAARELVVDATGRWPYHMRLLQLRWQVHFAMADWADAVAIGERLMVEDETARRDSNFHTRLIRAYRENGQAIKAVEVASRGVTEFPGDSRLFLLYTQLVRSESQTVVDRGLAAFPTVAEFQALRAQDLRTQGRRREALEATVAAVRLDSTISQGFLQLAQAYWDVGMPDSAYVALRRALGAGENPATVSQYALARGATVYGAAAPAEDPAGLELALRFFVLSDSAFRTDEASIAAGAAAASLARLAVNQAVAAGQCDPVERATPLIDLARSKFTRTSGPSAESGAPEMLGYLAALEPVVEQVRARVCPAPQLPPQP